MASSRRRGIAGSDRCEKVDCLGQRSRLVVRRNNASEGLSLFAKIETRQRHMAFM
jgi:hypothetical protein